MDKFPEVYRSLNTEQKLAVDTIDGPLLVFAGPGTGKTHLLSARVANILTKTDTPAKNILCLTFTENGAENMRERLSSFIGRDAYDVNISTYHAFGSELIHRFPEYFAETRLRNSVDDLGRRQIVVGIVETLSYANPLKQTRHHLGDLLQTISEVKRALLTSADLRIIAAENLQFIQQASGEIRELLKDFLKMPSINKAVPLFESILTILNQNQPKKPVTPRFGLLAQVAIKTLEAALIEATESSKTRTLTKWKNDWLIKDASNRFVLAEELESMRIQSLADVIDQYEAALEKRGLIDFDDMILRSIEVLESNDELSYTLQEQYLYVLLDEFQDTNPAQLKLVQLLTNNPVNEGRPNVMAVGDDDQAIYAFQGALYSNMFDFYQMYRDVKLINLTSNYRSHPDILLTAQNISEQINQRLHLQFDGLSKTLTAASTKLPSKAHIERIEFLSLIAQSDWIAHTVKSLIDGGTSPREIAILAPRHRQLEPIVPYLNKLDVPVRYEKRENILQAPVVKQLLTMSRLVLALQAGNEATAGYLWPEVLSYDFWNLPISSIWDVSWRVADTYRKLDSTKSTKHLSWSQALLESNQQFRLPALLFLKLATMVEQESCETLLDYLSGTIAVTTNETDLPQVYSPLRDYYTNAHFRETQPELFYETLSQLTVLRAKLRAHQVNYEDTMTLSSLIDFVDMYAEADERMINTNPYNQQLDAVQVMTVFKAKGLEYENVFLPSCQDDVWGSSSRTQSNHLMLPANLAPIRHAGATDDERLRILFVAATRAKFGLYLASIAQHFDGTNSKHLKYLDERKQDNGSIQDFVLPEEFRTVNRNDSTPPKLDLLELNWKQRHIAGPQHSKLSALLENRLNSYQLSPTHLNTFLDLEYGGPERFFFTSILRFPEAPTLDGQFGSAIHESLEWLQHWVTARGKVPPMHDVLTYFRSRLNKKTFAPGRLELEVERGERALTAYLTNRAKNFNPTDKAEVSFKNENVFVGDAHLAGKVDRLEISKKLKTITVVDYKTGKSYNSWKSDLKLLRYRRQLYCYKILVENSRLFAGYKVTRGRLEFIEPDKNDRINILELTFNNEELNRTTRLLEVMWQHVKQLQFPDIHAYDATTTGLRHFEQDLLDDKI
jgi:DNA helicase-2/ATP-dependent DNA helicase PcrA